MAGFSLATEVFDLSGSFETQQLGPRSDDGNIVRRSQFVATLDGDVVSQDFGQNLSDSEIKLEWFIDLRADDTRMRYLIQNYATLVLATDNGLYKIAPVSYESPGGRARFRARIITVLA